MRSPAFSRRTYAVLANLSAGYSPPLGRFRSITHPFAARQHVLLHLLPLDLHVLGTPPAFNLSQDQTLHLKISTIIKKSGSKMAPTYCWTFWSLGLFAKGLRRESPHKLPAKLLKSIPGAWPGKRAGKYTPTECLAHSLTAPAALRPGLQGPRSIAPIGGLSTQGRACMGAPGWGAGTDSLRVSARA